jgi:hypothetical protein
MGKIDCFVNYADIQNSEDGLISIKNAETVKNSDFDKEKDLVEYIENNIKVFCRDVLNDKYIEHETEKQSVDQFMFMPRRIRVDLYIECENKTYIIEVKNPTFVSENRYAIGQVLNYGIEFLDSEKEIQLILLTTKYDPGTAKLIEHYRLPITYIYFSKKHTLTFKRSYES